MHELIHHPVRVFDLQSVRNFVSSLCEPLMPREVTAGELQFFHSVLYASVRVCQSSAQSLGRVNSIRTGPYGPSGPPIRRAVSVIDKILPGILGEGGAAEEVKRT